MKQIATLAGIAAIAISALAAHAHASGLCKLTGTWTDEYGLATATIKAKHGMLAAPDICATNYTFTITDETKTGFNVSGKNKTKSCGKFSASPTFMNGCSQFGGSVTINGQTVSDVFTKQTPSVHAAPVVGPELTDGLR